MCMIRPSSKLRWQGAHSGDISLLPGRCPCAALPATPLYTWVAVLMALLCCYQPGAGWAQEETASTELVWPTTFNGQPDFDFHRDEVLEELKNKAARGVKVPLPADVPAVLAAPLLDPFQLGENANENLFAESGGSNLNIPELPSLADFVVVTPELPELNLEGEDEQAEVDLSEFESFLANLALRHRTVSEADLQFRDFNSDLRKVTVQSIVTSPSKYVVLNGQRYVEGDRFTLEIEGGEEATTLEDVIDTYMPSPAAVPPEVYERYENLKNETLAAHEDALEREKLRRKAFGEDDSRHVSALVERIEQRRVFIRIFGRTYEIKMRLIL